MMLTALRLGLTKVDQARLNSKCCESFAHPSSPLLFRLQRFFDETMDDHEASIPVQDAAKALGLTSMTERLPGMEVPLMPHQLIGVSWMVKQELGRVQGGVLA
jgi:hypothetical protein